ncbi:MAG: hypothetical protein R6X14_03955 [bacterium]
MKAAVVYYTRFGHNEVIAEAMAAELAAPRTRIETTRQYGYAVMGFRSYFNLGMRLRPMPTDFAECGLLVLCTPIWAWKPAPPARTFLKRAKLPPRLAVCFSTGGGPTLRAQEKVRQLLADRGVAVVAFGEIDTRPGDEEQLRQAARAFAHRLAAESAPGGMPRN